MEFTIKKSTHHCHTKWSDGANTPQEMIEAAIELGFKEIGISDHLCIHPTIPEKIYWGLKVHNIENYVKEVKELAFQYKQKIKVRVGLEVDFFSEYHHGLPFSLTPYNLDYIIGSVHFVGENFCDLKPDHNQNLTDQDIHFHYHQYWEKMTQLVDSDQFHIIGHIDLPKKNRVLPKKYSPELANIIDSLFIKIAQKGIMVEINTSGMKMPCQECYPSQWILEKCYKNKINLILNDDAHSIKDLGQFYSLVTWKVDETENKKTC